MSEKEVSLTLTPETCVFREGWRQGSDAQLKADHQYYTSHYNRPEVQAAAVNPLLYAWYLSLGCDSNALKTAINENAAALGFKITMDDAQVDKVSIEVAKLLIEQGLK